MLIGDNAEHTDRQLILNMTLSNNYLMSPAFKLRV